MDRTKKTRLTRFWREWVKPIAAVLVICGSFRSAVADWNDVPTGSMKPSIVEGDRILVNKMAYGLRMPFTPWWLLEFDGPQRGDIVVLFSPADGTRLVKRVVGLPGDWIELRDNRLIINGQPAAYERLDPEVETVLTADERAGHLFAGERVDGEPHPVMAGVRRSSAGDFDAVQVPPHQYFVMGDNRDNSRDSRVFGCVERDMIVGRASRVIVSVDPDHYYSPRWDRFLRRLP